MVAIWFTFITYEMGIYSLMNGYDFFYKYNNFSIFINGTIDYYFESISIDEDKVKYKKQIKFIPYDKNILLRGKYVPSECRSVEEFHSYVLKKIYKPNAFVQDVINKNSLIKLKIQCILQCI